MLRRLKKILIIGLLLVVLVVLREDHDVIIDCLWSPDEYWQSVEDVASDKNICRHLKFVFKKVVGADTCTDIFHYGHHERDVWITHGCQLHNYSMTDVRTCTERKRNHMGPMHIAFVGDSRIRDSFFQLVSYFDSKIKAEKLHTDLSFRFSNDVTLEYSFKKFMNASLSSVYDEWLKHDIGSGRPELVIVSVAAWMICHYDKGKPREVAFNRYKDEFRNMILPRLKKLESMGTKVVWKLQDQVVTPRMHITQIKCHLTSEQFDAYNTAAKMILNGTEITVWHSSRTIADHWVDQLGDGLHYFGNRTCLDQQVNLLLNYICNRFMGLNSHMCCSK